MPGHFPGPIGFAAFAGVKFAGYTLAGSALRRIFPGTSAGTLTIAVARTAAGLAVGVSHLLLWAKFLAIRTNSDDGPFLLSLIILRLIIWTLTVWFFCDKRWERPRRTLACAVAGTAYSFLLDAVGIALALVTPGQVPFC